MLGPYLAWPITDLVYLEMRLGLDKHGSRQQYQMLQEMYYLQFNFFKLLPSHTDTCIALKLQCFVSFWTFCLPFQFLFPSLFLQSLSCFHLHLLSSLFINALCKLQTTKILGWQFIVFVLRVLLGEIWYCLCCQVKSVSDELGK